MESNLTVSITYFQAILSLAFQVWLVVFPIIIIKKLNYIVDVLQAQFEDEDRDTPQASG
ncbi:MAG TPA: hypothetical protein PKO44_04825 [Candidatus Omnitrophota bacterium]|nr:hypothetical protein [Candidatus Omnitrophota bacterium]